MKNLRQALKSPRFLWLPKHLQHITENIIFKNRNVSFLATNALFRQKQTYEIKPSELGNDHFVITDYVDLQQNDRIRNKAEELSAIFNLDKHDNIIVITAYSENDDYNSKY
jgi:hypothetical protein